MVPLGLVISREWLLRKICFWNSFYYSQAEDLYCTVCDLSFTSQLHAQQHFQGRNHTRKAAGLAPLKTGYFNTKTGKWQRHPTEETVGGIPAGVGGEASTSGSSATTNSADKARIKTKGTFTLLGKRKGSRDLHFFFSFQLKSSVLAVFARPSLPLAWPSRPLSTANPCLR